MIEERRKYHENHDHKIGDGESMNMVNERAANVLKKIIQENSGKTILICSHGSPLR
jgi:Fructose-2,6-bisphosphatase